VDGTPIESIVSRHAVGVTKAGGVAKSYTLIDVMAILRESEFSVKETRMADLEDVVKVKNFYEIMGYAGYVSGREEDRRKLYVNDVCPLRRKSDGKQFGHSIITKSIGSGKDGRFTVFNKVFDINPIAKGDIIYCKDFTRDGAYFQLKAYDKVM